MPRIVREADLTWEGSSAKGTGTFTAATSGAFAGLPYTEPTRVFQPEGHTSPEELLAAAHGGCFTMALAAELTKARTPPDRLDVRCTVTMDEVEGLGHQIVHSHIEAQGRVPGADAPAFRAAADAADAGCPFSRLLRATAEVTVTATLVETTGG
ncbi:MAG: OsmC family peroxiredoxin [Actinobacteria bacterium]|nr:OsmC family peroxiredoxin [Actinomycetota bacterium]